MSHGADEGLVAISWIGFILLAVVVLAAESKKKGRTDKKPAESVASSASGLEVSVSPKSLQRSTTGDLAAWRQMQRIAYTMVGPDVPQDRKDAFKKLMIEFAESDPLYRKVISICIPLINESPGMKQSDITRALESDEQKELVRYALYFAHELGEIRRVKKGNSYQLFPVQDKAPQTAL